jgi:hypothetical protein
MLKGCRFEIVDFFSLFVDLGIFHLIHNRFEAQLQGFRERLEQARCKLTGLYFVCGSRRGMTGVQGLIFKIHLCGYSTKIKQLLSKDRQAPSWWSQHGEQVRRMSIALLVGRPLVV